MRLYRDRDYISTLENMLFSIIGNVHPPDRVFAYLKYMPSPEGRWGRVDRFERVLKAYVMPAVEETLHILERGYPWYIYDSKAWSIRISAVPLTYVKDHYRPEERLRALQAQGAGDALELKALELASMIARESRVEASVLGVTGSILLGIHNPSFSDIDLTVYGRRDAARVKKGLERLYEASTLQRYDEGQIMRWATKKAEMTPLTLDEARALYHKMWGRGVYKGVEFSIHPVKLEEEVDEKYGERIFTPEGLAKVEALVTDARDAPFLPATYRVAEASVEGVGEERDMEEVVTYDGLYSGLLQEGEWMEAMGKLEMVYDRRSQATYHRLVIGTFEAKGRDYIKPMGEGYKPM